MSSQTLQAVSEAIPPRSRLFHLEPIGVGSAFIESLSGYVARLAEQHRVTTNHLFSKEIALYIHKPGTISSQVSFEKFAKAINGTGVTASDLIDVFERLTLCRDLRFTTMVPWQSVFPDHALIRETRAWCPACYEEQADGSPYVYDQLIWAVKAVSVCDKHKMPLKTECPRCSRRQHHLTFRSRPGFCSSCKAWLGSKESLVGGADTPAVTDISVKIAGWVGGLLAAAPRLGEHITVSNLLTNLAKRLREHYGGRSTPTSSISFEAHSSRSWIRGKNLPSLTKLLEKCVALDVSPVDLICTLAEEADASVGMSKPGGTSREKAGNDTERKEVVTRRIRRADWHTPEVLAGIERELRAALEEWPPVSVAKFTAKFGYNEITLRRKFPALTAKMAERSLAYYRPKMDVERAAKALKLACSEEPPPPLREVAGRLGPGHSASYLQNKFPEECKIIVARHAAHFRRRIDYRTIESSMRQSLREDPPQSLAALCRKLEVAEPYLQRELPELCACVRRRYVEHLQEEIVRRRVLMVEEITSNVRAMLRDGVRPTISLLKAKRSVPCGSALFYRECLRIMRGFDLI